jgi:hypothetical protein
VAAFASSNTTSIFFSADTEINGIVFNAGASTFTITADQISGFGRQLTISGLGIMNNSGITQNFVGGAGTFGNYGKIVFTNSATAGTLTMFTNIGGEGGGSHGGFMNFRDTSTAGDATFINNGATAGQAGGGTGGAVQFSNSSTAGNGNFTNNGGEYINAGGGSVVFFDSSTAGSGTFTNNGGAHAAAQGGGTGFFNNSTAGSGTFTNNGTAFSSATGGFMTFSGTSTAGNATLVANSGTQTGALIQFGDDSTGGTARVEVFGNGSGDSTNGSVDISPHHNAAAVTIGSIEGSGNVFVGSNHLSVGSNNTSRSFSGLIQEQGSSGGSQGSFTKIGSGTLTIEGGANNNYIADGITLGLSSGGPVNLNFTGAPDAILSLLIDGVTQMPGLYGGPGSGAPHQIPQLTGTGTLLVRAIAVSRRIQGGTPFDLPLTFNKPAVIECRSGGINNNYQIVVMFANPATFSSVDIVEGQGFQITSGNGTQTITIDLSQLSNGHTIVVRLYGLNDGTTTADLDIPMSILIGDTSGNGIVNASDVSQTKAQTGQPITASNFREDVNGNGAINASDVALVKSKSGDVLTGNTEGSNR